MRRKIGWVWALSALLCVGWVGAAAAVQEVEPNDATPQALGTLSPQAMTISVNGASGYAGDIDWYSFEVGGSAAQSVRLATDSAASWQIVLYSENLAHVASGTDSLIEDLSPGAYRVRIQQSDLGKESYVLLLSNALESESNDGLVEATPLGVLQTESLIAFASIDPPGDVDFFSFDVPADFSLGLAPGFAKVVRIETPCPTGDTLILLYAADKAFGYAVPIARNDDSGSGSWSRLYLVDPSPGRYTLRVDEYADNELIPGYRVVVTPMTIADAEPNDTPDRATPLGELQAGGRLETTQFIGEADVDAFSFTVASQRCVLIETSGASNGDSVVCLLDSAGNEIACDDDGGAGTWSRLFRKLDAGRYTITVRGADETDQFDYTLTLTASTCPAEASESEPNNGLAAANSIVLPVDVSAEIAPNDPDFFRFTLTSHATIMAETYGAADGDTTVCFLDADGETIVCDDDGGSKLWSLAEFELDPGTYFVKVELYAGTQSVAYHLLVRAEE